MEHKETKNNQSEQQKEKRIPQNKDSTRILWDNFKKSNIHIIGMPEGEGKLNIYLKNNERKLPQFGEGNRHASSGSTESPKENECKEAHSKKHHY